jgi:hypothetical protein
MAKKRVENPRDNPVNSSKQAFNLHQNRKKGDPETGSPLTLGHLDARKKG